MPTALADIAPQHSGAAQQWRKNLDDFGYSASSDAASAAMKFSRADAAKLMAEFDEELTQSLARKNSRDVFKGVAPELATMFQAANAQSGGYADTISQVVEALKTINADLVKDISITSPLSSGFVPYDLQAPSKKVFPALTPLRNRLPRTGGQGTAARFKRVDGITGSGTGGVGLNSPFISEFSTTSTWGSSTLVRPPKIAYSATDVTFNYKFLGASDSVTFGSEWAGRGYESMRALSSFSLLKSMMLMEENAIVAARITGLSAPATPTGTPRSAQTGETAISGATGTGTPVYLKVSALGQFGESAVSTATTGITVTNGTSVVDVLVVDVTGALGYKLYVSTGTTDPGDAARFYAGTFAANQFTLTGALPTTGDTASNHAADSTGSANNYDGLFTQVDANGTSRRINAAISATMFDADLQSVWNKYKADPDEIFLHGTDRLNFSNAVIPVGSQNTAYRLQITPDDAGSVLAGAMVSQLQNKITGKAIKLTVHPWFAQGNAFAASWALPFPWSEVPNTVEVRNVQDYLQIDWPTIQMSYDLSILLYGAVVVYAPTYFIAWHGIPQSYAATSGPKFS